MQLKHGLVWVWPQRGANAFLRASQKQPAKLPEEQMDFGADNAMYSVNPVSWALMLENSMDPSHAASLHEGPGLGTRKDMVSVHLLARCCARGGGMSRFFWGVCVKGICKSQRYFEVAFRAQLPTLIPVSQ